MMTKDGLIFEANSLKQGRLQALTRQQLQAQATQNRERRWAPSGVTLLREPGLSNDVLEHSDGVLTAAALGIAQTGTIVLDSGPGQGRRAISLLPDYHLCVIRDDQVLGLVPEAVARMHTAASDSARPITLLSGPSATSDIELNRVEGVHGPRTLEVLLVTSLVLDPI
jgi:L-lactate dehydrogenase complex protein LldG